MSYIPKDDAGKLAWFINFNNWLAAHGTDHGLSAAEVAEFNTQTGDSQTAFTGNVEAHAAAKAAVELKDTVFGVNERLARNFAQRLQHDPTMTNEDRAAAGLTVPDKKPTKSDPDEILETEAPQAALDFSKRGQVTIHWGPNPLDERHNGRPHDTIGAEIQFHRGGVPATEAEWQLLEMDTDSPCVHVVHEDEPTTYAYRVRYVGKNLKHGPHGDPVVCTVSV